MKPVSLTIDITQQFVRAIIESAASAICEKSSK